jgi:tetratricopeptide (TPR) repeat protein
MSNRDVAHALLRAASPLLATQGVLICFAISACTHRIITVHDPLPPAAPAVRATMQRQIRNAVDAGEGDIELRRLRDRVAAAPNDVDARLALAAHYGARGFSDLQLEHYRLASERFPNSAPAALALAKALRAANQNVASRDTLVSFCKRNPQAPAELFSIVGILEDDLGNIESAEPWHRAAVERQPNRDSLHNNLGYNLLLQQHTTQAAAEFRRALDLNPRSEIARNNLGVALAADPKEAVLEWQSISDPATAHSNLAAVFIEQKRYAVARREIQAALEYSPKHPAALENLRLLAELDGKGAEVSKATARHRVAAGLRKLLGANPASN